MSLLLDALKKAALEKQRREQSAQGEAVSSAQSSAPSSSTENVSDAVAPSITNPVENKNTDAKDAAATETTAEAALEFDLDAIDDNYRLVMEGEQQTTTIAEEYIESSAQDLQLSLTQQEVVVSNVASSPVTSEALLIDETLIEKSVTEANSSNPFSAATPKTSHLKKAAPETKAVEKTESTPAFVPTADVATADTPAVEPIAAVQPIATNTITHFNAHSGKDALNQLLSRSSQAAQRARKRMMVIYALLTFTSVTLVGLYYYLLSSGGVSSSFAANNFPVTTNSDLMVANAAPEDAQINADEAVPVAETAQQTDDTLITTDADTYTPPDADVDEKTISITDEKKSSSTKPTASTPKVAVTAAAITEKNAKAKAKQSTAATTAAPSVSLPAEQTVKHAMISRNAAVDDISESIRRGYEAYQAGDYAGAELAYRDALAEDPHQRDALLGAAAVAVQLNRQEEALRFYQQRLTRAPKDEYAQAGILALTTSSDNNPQFDSELNRLLREFPNAAHLHFLKGSLFAAQQQWGAAQLAFFEAWQRDNKNPNYAFNLAVAMDHIQVPKEALHFYQQALLLSTGRQVGFSTAAVQQRVQELEQQ